jgi:hypothetical protein
VIAGSLCDRNLVCCSNLESPSGKVARNQRKTIAATPVRAEFVGRDMAESVNR